MCMETEVIMLYPVLSFLKSLEKPEEAKLNALVLLLGKSSNKLSMPEAKPIGNGLWELRLRSPS